MFQRGTRNPFLVCKRHISWALGYVAGPDSRDYSPQVRITLLYEMTFGEQEQEIHKARERADSTLSKVHGANWHTCVICNNPFRVTGGWSDLTTCSDKCREQYLKQNPDHDHMRH